jgi:Sulfatase-modifying factor enzyme 1
MNLQQHNEEETNKDYELLKQLEDKRREEDDPRKITSLKRQIDTIKQCIQDRDNDSTPEKRNSEQETSSSSKFSHGDLEQSAICFNLFSWTEIFRKNLKDSGFLIRENKFSDREEAIFTNLDEFMLNSLEAGLIIEIYDSQERNHIPISDNIEFWAVLIASLSMTSDKQGYLKWLIKETFKIIKECNQKKLAEDSILSKIWQYIFNKYCESLNRSSHQSEMLENICDVIVSCAEENYSADFLHNFVSFIYDLMGEDTISIGTVAAYLDRYDSRLGNDTTPKYLQVLKRLVGTGINTSIHGVNQIPSFSPKLVEIYNPSICDYKFEAMVYTLTVLDYTTIRGILPRNTGRNPKEPYIFEIVSTNEMTLFNLLTAEILSIVKLCQDSEKDKNLIWDVPNVCEWLALADCVEQPYPWGTEDPQKNYANVHFSYTQSKLHPVGTYPLGASKFGTYDCCGNVHEIVRISEASDFPENIRLMGGCYTTPAFASSCQIIRRFKAQKEDNRRNVGLRLIRYNSNDCDRRLFSLQNIPDNARNVKNIWKSRKS